MATNPVSETQAADHHHLVSPQSGGKLHDRGIFTLLHVVIMHD